MSCRPWRNTVSILATAAALLPEAISPLAWPRAIAPPNDPRPHARSRPRPQTASNTVTSRLTIEGKRPLAAVVYGKLGTHDPIALLVKIPPGTDPGAHTHSSEYYGVVVSGSFHHFTPG